MESVSEFSPRAYQIDLYEEAVKNNIILYLPTGAGKTYIAVMLLKKLSGDIQMLYSNNGKRSIFIVNTVALVLQQTDYIKRHTGLTCKGYSGEMKVDFWSSDEWIVELDENQVLVMTAQIFVDIITRGNMKLDRVNLIVFDECHRAVNNHPMRQIMQQFENYPKIQLPRILGMSATLLNGNIKPEKLESTIKDLEVTFHAKITTVKSIDSVQQYCTNPKENIIKYAPYSVPNVIVDVDKIIDSVTNILNNIVLDIDKLFIESSSHFQPKKKTSKLLSIIKNIRTIIKQTGTYGGNKSALLHLIQVECLKKYSTDKKTIIILDYLITQITRIRKLLTAEMKNYSELQQIYKFSSNQMHKLFEILKDFNKNKLSDQKFCCIIFVKERFTTQVIYHILKSLASNDDQYKFLLPDFIVGFQNNPYKNTRENMCMAKWQKEVLQRFKKGLCNCIIATDVVDEGIDIPTCTMVVRYDLPMDYRAYVQSKGRARHGMSYYKILMPEDNYQFLAKYRDYKMIESNLKKILMGNAVRMIPTDKDIEDNLYQYDIKPYQVKGTKNVLTENTVVNLINKYCNNLMRSEFVSLVPVWNLYHANNNMYQVSLKLPMISPLKDVIKGDPMPAINSAKQSAAMKCCIQLHQIGELTDNLEPITSNAILEEEKTHHLFPNWINEDDSTCGTQKKKRQHEIMSPAVLCNAFPSAKKELYLHILHATPTYSIPYDSRHLVFYNLLQDLRGFGILSTKKLPEIPSFPIFMNVGELNVTVESNRTTMQLNDKDIELLRTYHTSLFTEVIPVIKKFMVFDNYNLENSFLIVPVNTEWKIDWDTVNEFQHIKRDSPVACLHPKYSEYELALVNPTYRASPSVYIVTQVCEDRTPESCFPTEDFSTYAHYYKDRYGLPILKSDQPLLEVKAISTKINCIKPRSMKPGLSKRKRADALEDFEEHLIPELCLRIRFPSLYWLKATTLPSIIHRITQLLVAEDLRVTIVKEANLGALILPHHGEWPSLEETENEVEHVAERLMLDTTLDDSIENTQPESDLNELELDEVNSYRWSKDQEPQDLYRDIEQIQMLDIQYYHHFMSANVDDNINNTKSVTTKNINYIERPIVTVPPLKVLTRKSLHGPSSVEIMQALTCKMSHDMFNLERLETLGDSYLKFITTLYLFHTYPKYNEGQLTALKGKIIGNRNLYYCGTNKKIPGCMKVDEFVPMSTFIVPAYTVYRPLQRILLDLEVSPNILFNCPISEEEKLTGCVKDDTLKQIETEVLNWFQAESQTGFEQYLGIQIVPDKAVADSVEALIGVYLRSIGLQGAAKLLTWFGILPSNMNIEELLNGNPLDPIIGKGDVNEHIPWANKLETRIGYKFKNRAFLLQAVTHPSYTPNGITECYQRLEFLGDAILDFLITCHIYEACGDLSPGDLTDLRSALVNNITFACLAVRYGLHTCLLSYAPALHKIIDRFVKFQEERNYTVDDELLCILLEEEDCNIAEYIDVPKVLGDLYETLIGAIYLDTNKNLQKVWELVYSFMHKEIDEFSKNIPKQPVRLIYEHRDAHAKFHKAVPIEERNVIMVPLKVTIDGKEKTFHGFGVNKKLAKCAAAKQALKRLRRQK